MIEVLKSGRGELEDIAGHNHFWYDMSDEYPAKAVNDFMGCGRFKRYDPRPF